MPLSNVTGHGGLARRRLGVTHLVFFTVSASAPMTVLLGGITVGFAVTGNLGLPLAFPVIALALGLFAVGYAAMSRYVSNAGAFYAYLAQGLGRAYGVGGSFVALVAYNAVQVGLYGLFGATFGALMGDRFGVDVSWWVWALGAMVLIGVLGVLRVDLNARVLAVLLIAECLAVLVFDLIALANPDNGVVSTEALRPDHLFTASLGGVFAFAIASFVGFESGAIYSEEARDPRRTVARATYIAVAFTGIFYAFSAWAMTVAVGPDKMVSAAAEQGPGVIFGLINTHLGALVTDIATVLLVTSIFAALLSFHNGVARYFFALGRERVLPPALGRTGVGSGAPIAGSLLQSLLGLAGIIVFSAAGRDPVTEMFTWLSYVGAVGVLVLMTGTALAVVGFFLRREAVENTWQRLVAPVLGAAALLAMTLVTVYQAPSVLGAAKDSALRVVLPAVVLVALVLGLIWGVVLKRTRPDIYPGIGRGATEPVEPGPALPVPARL